MRGMEVSAIELAAGEWTDVVVGRVLDGRRHPNADTLWLTRVDVGRRAESWRSCAARRTSRSASSCRRRWSAPCCPATGASSAPRSAAQVSNGMLCSADRARARDRCGRDPHPWARRRAAARHTAGRGAGRDSARRRRQAEPRRRALDGRAGARDRRIHRRGAAPAACRAWRERRDRTSAHVVGAHRGAGAQPALHGALVRRRRPTARRRTGCSAACIAAGMRPISAVVDVTNYVMHELGQPMHAYDADAVPGGRIVVRRARDGERLETIDHVERTPRRADAGHRRRGAGDRPGRDHGRRINRGRPGHQQRHPRVRDLPRSDDPQHGSPSGAAVGGEHAPREGDRADLPRCRGRPCRAPHRRDHRCAGGARDRRQRPRAEAAASRGGARSLGSQRLLGMEPDAAAWSEASSSHWVSVSTAGLRSGGERSAPPAGRDRRRRRGRGGGTGARLRAHRGPAAPRRAAAVSGRPQRASPSGAPDPGRHRGRRDGRAMP